MFYNIKMYFLAFLIDKIEEFFSVALAVTALVMGFASCKPDSKDADEVKLMFNELSLKVGETQQVKVVKATGDVTWTTASEAIATVDAQGNITGVAEGQTVATAKVGEASAVVNVTVSVAVPVPAFLRM